MADRIDDIVDRGAVSKQIVDTTTELNGLLISLKDNLQAALQLNQALGQSQSMAQLRTNAEAAAQAEQRLAEGQLRILQQEQRLQQLELQTARQRAQTLSAEERLERQRQTNEANDQRRAAASNQRATQATQRAREQSRPYQLLTLALREAEAAASDLGTVFGANSPQFQQAAARVQELRTQVDSIEQPLGRFQRNVGNYASGVTGALQTGFGYLRTAANIIPGLGLSGIFLLGFEGLKSLTQQLGFFKESTSSAREVLKSLNEVNKNASDEYGKQSTNLRILYQAATDVTNSTEARLRAARELQKEFPTTFKNITTEAILNGDAKASYDKLTNSILDNAKARAAADKIADLAGKQQEIDFQKQKIRNAEESEIARQRRNRTGTIQLNNPNIDAVAATPAVLEAQQEKIIRDRANAAVKLQDQNRKILQDQIDFLTKYAGGNNKIADALSQDGGNTPKIKAPKDTSIQDQLAAIDRLIKRAADANDDIQKSDDASYKERFNSADNFVKATTELLNKRKEIELSAENLSKQARINISNETNDKIVDVERKAGDNRKKIQADINKEYEEAGKQLYKSLTESEKQQVREIQDAANQRLLVISDETKAQKEELIKRASDGKLTTEQYNQELFKIEQSAAAKRSEVQVAAARKVVESQAAALAFGIGSAEDLQKSTDALAKLEIDADNIKTQVILDNLKKRDEAIKNLHALEKDIATQSVDLIKTVIDAGYSRQLAALDDQAKAIDDNADREKKAVDRSLLTDQQKADKTALIEARQQAQNEALQKRQNKIKKEQAETDRLVALAQIAITTAQSVFSISSKAAEATATGFALAANPFTAAFAPAAFAAAGAISTQIPLIIALGAIQAAAVLATPLPQYAEGVRNKSQGSWSIFGEAGTEYVKEPGKQGYLTDGPTVGWLPAGTDVISNRELMAAMANPGKTNYVSNQLDLSALLQEQQTTRRELTKALEVKQDANYKRGYRNGKQFSEYINRNVR